ncbi:unnamed protein product [Prunus brigantina]
MPGSTQMPRHAETARAAYHDRVDGVSAGISTARALAAAAIRIGQRPEPIGGPACDRSTSDRGASPAPIRFPPDNFKHSLTLFSKSFSSFPREFTARLGLHSQTTRLADGASWCDGGPGTTGLSPSPAPPSGGLGPGPPAGTLLRTTIRTPWAPDSQAGLFPVRSPLLGGILPEPSNFFEPSMRDDRTRRATRGFATTDCRGVRRRGLGIYANRAARRTGRPSSAPPQSRRSRWGGQRRVTPGRACPRPNGFGRNLRSKTRWFTGFCNSHQVSHFATFFIDARAEISVAESRFDIFEDDDAARAHRFRGDGGRALSFKFLGAIRAGVRWTSRDVAGSEPPTSPRSEHFTGPFNRNGTGGTTRPIKAGSVSPVEGTSRPHMTTGGINRVAFLSDVGSVRDKRPCGSSARRGHDDRTCRAKTLPIGRSEARRPHARSMLRIRDHKQKLVDLHNLTTSRGLIGTQALLRCPPAAREGQEEERDNERHHSLTIGSQNRNPLTRTSQS